MLLDLDVKERTPEGGLYTVDRIERFATQRVGYKEVSYANCIWRVRWPAGRPRPGTRDRPFIGGEEPIRCRLDRQEKPTGQRRRDDCADFKRNYRFARRNRRNSDAAWWLARARWLRCAWRHDRRIVGRR